MVPFFAIVLLFLFSTIGAKSGQSRPIPISPPNGHFHAPVKPTAAPVVPEALPACLELACLEHLKGVLDMLFANGELSETKGQLCAHYFEAEKCMRSLSHCTDTLYPILTSGIKYMCVEQSNAFDALLGCIGSNSPEIKKECDFHCNPSSLVAGLAMKDTFMQSLDQPLVNQVVNVNMKELIEPHLGRIAFSEGCRITECLFECYKNKFDTRCEGTAGTLIMEMLARPLSYDLKELPLGTQILSGFFNGMLPHTCSFVFNKSKFRVDPDLDAEIRRMYANRKTKGDNKISGKPVIVKAQPTPVLPSSLDNPAILSGIPRGGQVQAIDSDAFPIDSNVDAIVKPKKCKPRAPVAPPSLPQPPSPVKPTLPSTRPTLAPVKPTSPSVRPTPPPGKGAQVSGDGPGEKVIGF